MKNSKNMFSLFILLTLKTFLIVNLIIFIIFGIILFVSLYGVYIKPNPKINSLIGMTRVEVIAWLDKNGRADKYLYGEDYDYVGDILIGSGTFTNKYKSKQEIENDKYIMKQIYWDVGFKKVSRGRIFSSKIKFKDDKVIEQSDCYTSDF